MLGRPRRKGWRGYADARAGGLSRDTRGLGRDSGDLGGDGKSAVGASELQAVEVVEGRCPAAGTRLEGECERHIAANKEGRMEISWPAG